MTRQIAIVTDDAGWHGQRMREAFVTVHCSVRFVSLQDCKIDISGPVPTVEMPGFEQCLPDGVFVRAVAGGSLEEIVFYLDVLHALRHLGVPVYNDARSIERTVDKAMTSFLLRAAGISTPPTWVLRDLGAAQKVVDAQSALGHRTVLKPLFGSQGTGLRLLERAPDMGAIEPAGGIFYLQRYIEREDGDWFDWRVFVIGGRAVAAMRRDGSSWITNVKQGASCHAALIDSEMRRLSESAVDLLGLYYGGVDLIEDGRGRICVLEVNSIPAWKGLQSVCSPDIAHLLATDFMRVLDERVLSTAEQRA